MIDHFGINCSDLAAAAAFYDQVLGALGFTRLMDFGVAIGYGADKPDFWIGRQPAEGPARAPTARSTSRSWPPTPRAVRAFFDGRHGAGRRGAARAAVLAGVPRAYYGGVRPRPGRQQRRGRLPHRASPDD